MSALSFYENGSDEYQNMLIQVVDDSKRNHFKYEKQIQAFAMMHAFCHLVGHSIAIDTKGWVILLEGDDFVEIKFVFVQPEHRRTGWFTDLLKKLRERQKRITVCTRESDMVRALISKGFSFHGRSKDGKELFYILETWHPLFIRKQPVGAVQTSI